MKNYSLTVIAQKRPETLERILRIVRHRGFEVICLNATYQEQKLHLTMTVQSTREIALLNHQLIKLPDVLSLQ